MQKKTLNINGTAQTVIADPEASLGDILRKQLMLTGTTSGKSVVCELHKEIIPRLRRLEALKKERKAGAGTPSAE